MIAALRRAIILLGAAVLTGCATGPFNDPANVDAAAAAAATERAASGASTASAAAASAAASASAAAASAATPSTAAASASPVATASAVEVLLPPPRGGWRNRERAGLPPDPDRTDLWVRVRNGLSMPELDNDLVRKWEEYYASRPDYVIRMMDRSSRYLFHIVEEVEARGLPMELALLPFIESAFNPQALSSASAAGMWQFVAATGRDFDLRQNVFRDDRRDVIASTRAALDYLQQLYAQFDDWQLALAAYNWGQGSVQRAQRSNAKRGRPQDYASLDMPLETRNYVPKLMAVKNLVQRPGAFNLSLPALENHPYFLAVRIERDIDVALAAQLAGLDLEAFQQFNPQMNQPVILAAGTPQLLLPYDNANRFLRSLQEHRGPLATWTAWVAPRTLSVADAAREVGMSEAALREVNRIPPRMRVRAGSALLVPRPASALADVNEHLAEHAAILLQPEGPSLRRVVVRAGARGDSVSAVARRYGVSASQVAKWNGVGTGDRFKARSSIVVMLPNRSGGKARASGGGGGKNQRAVP
ncbi:MAG: transglycosylase SLT domain-containing protein, partial [Rubrivivax sp.]